MEWLQQCAFMLRSLFWRKERWSCTCSKRQSQPGIVGGAVMERPSTKIRPRNLWRLPFRENWTPRKFTTIWYLTRTLVLCHSCPLTGDSVVSSSDGSECFYIPKVDRLVQPCTSYLLTFSGICQTSVMRQKDSKETEDRDHLVSTYYCKW